MNQMNTVIRCEINQRRRRRWTT